MRQVLSGDESHAFEALRVVGAGPYGGADFGEVVATMSRIREGSDDSWTKEWSATASRVHAIADECLRSGHRISARDAYLRASNYYRTAEFYLRNALDSDNETLRELLRLSRLSRATFVQATDLIDRPVRRIDVPYENIELPGYLFLVDDSGEPRSTIIYTNGFDSTAEEAWFAIAAAGLERGYNVLAYDGPGQGALIREHGVRFRPDWEAVLGPVIDFAVALPEVDARQVAHFGYSLGAYLVARTAAFDHRASALILDDGMFDFHAAYRNAAPGWLMNLIYAERDWITNPLASIRTRLRTSARWGLNNGLWTMGGDSYADFVRRTRAYTLEGVVEQITTPTLIMDAEADHFQAGQADVLAAALRAPSTLVRLTSAEGAGEHCHVGSLLRAHQVIFDWLDETTTSRDAPTLAATEHAI